MLEWLTANAVAVLALIVSASSFAVSWRTAVRARAREAITAYIELSATGEKEYLRAKLHVKNPSPADLRIEKLSIDLPDFRLVDIDSVAVDDGAGNRVLPERIRPTEPAIAMSVVRHVASGETVRVEFLIYQPAHSQRRSTKVNVMYWRLGPTPKWIILPIRIVTRTSL